LRWFAGTIFDLSALRLFQIGSKFTAENANFAFAAIVLPQTQTLSQRFLTNTQREQVVNSSDLKEGQAAFLEKRKPQFRGK